VPLSRDIPHTVLIVWAEWIQSRTAVPCHIGHTVVASSALERRVCRNSLCVLAQSFSPSFEGRYEVFSLLLREPVKCLMPDLIGPEA